MTRGRSENQVCVVTDAATTGHGHHRPLEPVEILAEMMRRSSTERSASETLRHELDRGEDPVTLRRLWEQARRYIDTGAGPDRRPELRRLRHLQAQLPTMAGILAANQRELDRIDRLIASVQRGLVESEASLEGLLRRRWFHRPDPLVVQDAEHKLQAQRLYLDGLTRQQTRSVDQLERSQRRLRDAQGVVERIPEVEAAIARRSRWLLDHPAELEWEADLAARLRQADRSPERSTAQSDSIPPEDELATALGIDLRTIDLSPHRPRAGIECRTGEALGIDRPSAEIEIAFPPVPGRGIDGPDLGL
jgi:hypothetical protein